MQSRWSLFGQTLTNIRSRAYLKLVPNHAFFFHLKSIYWEEESNGNNLMTKFRNYEKHELQTCNQFYFMHTKKLPLAFVQHGTALLDSWSREEKNMSEEIAKWFVMFLCVLNEINVEKKQHKKYHDTMCPICNVCAFCASLMPLSNANASKPKMNEIWTNRFYLH